MNVMGIIFANDGSLSELTTSRTMASLPFGGRYRQIDFALSNLAAAGIHHIGLISRHHFQSLMYHVGGGEEYGLELEEGGLEYLTPYSMSATDTYRGKLDSLNSVMGFLQYGSDEEYVVMTDSAILSNIDLQHVLKTHIESGKDITVVTKTGIARRTAATPRRRPCCAIPSDASVCRRGRRGFSQGLAGGFSAVLMSGSPRRQRL